MFVVLVRGYDGLITRRLDQDSSAELSAEGASALILDALAKVQLRSTNSGNEFRENAMANSLRRVTVAPKGMGLYDFVLVDERAVHFRGMLRRLDDPR